MKRMLCLIAIVTILLMGLAIGVSADSKMHFANGNSFYSNGGEEFFSNSEDEDRLYVLRYADESEKLVLDEHVISVINGEDRLYLLTYDNGNSVLGEFDTVSYSYTPKKVFNSLVTCVALRNNTLFYLESGDVCTYDLIYGTTDKIVEDKNAELLFFSDYDTLKYYARSNKSDELTEYIYSFGDTVYAGSVIVSNKAAMASLSSYSPRLTEPTSSNPYYIHTSSGGLNECIEISGGSVLPNCVGYAWGRSYENLGSRPNLYKGNAESWYNYNINNGYYQYGSVPELGAVVVWSKGVVGDDSDGAGHVAVVEVIDGDTVITSESGYGSFYFKTVTRSASDSNLSQYSSYKFLGYIYVCGTDIEPDSEAPTISNLTATNISSESFTIECDLDDNIGVTRVWLNIYGPNDSVKGYGVAASNGKFSQTINTADCGGMGIYSVDIYVYDMVGNEVYAAVSDINTKPPTNVSLSINKGMYGKYAVGETVTFNFCALDASGYTLVVEKNAQPYNEYQVSESTFALYFDDADAYSAYLKATNNAGETHSEWVVWYVEKKPVNAVLNIDKPSYSTYIVNDIIKFSFSADYTLQYTLILEKSGKPYREYILDSNSFELSFNDIGDYSARIKVSNDVGEAYSDWVVWYVELPDDCEPYSTLYLQGKRYVVYNISLSWNSAEELCKRLGGKLAEIGDSTVNQHIMSILMEGTYWLGGTDVFSEGEWTWRSGKKFEYTNWQDGQPDNWHDIEHYLTINNIGLWNDCSIDNEVTGFICEFESALGDANGDGTANPMDLAFLQRYLGGWSGYDDTKVNVAALDLNSDGKVNPLDAAVLARHIAKWVGYETLPYSPS